MLLYYKFKYPLYFFDKTATPTQIFPLSTNLISLLEQTTKSNF